MATPAPEIDIPSTSTMVLVCYACLGTRWEGPTQRLWEATVDGVPMDAGKIEGDLGDGQWHCGDCGHHKCLLVSRDGLAKTKAARGVATT